MKAFASQVLLGAVLCSALAFAGEDDDLAPITPITPVKGASAKPKPKPVVVKPKPKPVSAKKPTEDEDLAPIAPLNLKGELAFKLVTNVSGAIAVLDGKDLGALPLATQVVTVGDHSLTVKRPGYAAFVKKITVVANKSVEVEVKLVAVAAVLSVQSDVTGARVLLNGRELGIAPLREVEVPPGPAEVAVVKEGYKEDAQRIVFVAGRDYPVTVQFNPVSVANDKPFQTSLTPSAGQSGPPLGGVSISRAPSPITGKWYFWAGIAAGVVAVAAGSIAASVAIENRPLTESEICGKQGCARCIQFECALQGQ
jgi:PEGA domain